MIVLGLFFSSFFLFSFLFYDTVIWRCCHFHCYSGHGDSRRHSGIVAVVGVAAEAESMA